MSSQTDTATTTETLAASSDLPLEADVLTVRKEKKKYMMMYVSHYIPVPSRVSDSTHQTLIFFSSSGTGQMYVPYPRDLTRCISLEKSAHHRKEPRTRSIRVAVSKFPSWSTSFTYYLNQIRTWHLHMRRSTKYFRD